MTDQVSPAVSSPNYIELAANIVSAYVTRNSVPVADLPALIGNVHTALRNVANPAMVQIVDKPTPVVPIKKSVTPDFLISLEDGKPYRSLKRHLAGRGLTPEQYREKWGLPRDYPMVAPNYSAHRSELARNMGLGRQRAKAGRAQAAAPGETAKAEAPKRGRKKAT